MITGWTATDPDSFTSGIFSCKQQCPSLGGRQTSTDPPMYGCQAHKAQYEGSTGTHRRAICAALRTQQVVGGPCPDVEVGCTICTLCLSLTVCRIGRPINGARAFILAEEVIKDSDCSRNDILVSVSKRRSHLVSQWALAHVGRDGKHQVRPYVGGGQSSRSLSRCHLPSHCVFS